MLCDMPSQLTSIPLNSKRQDQDCLVAFAKDSLVRILWSTFSLKQQGPVALLMTILAPLSCVYKRSVSLYLKQHHMVVSMLKRGGGGGGQDLMVLLFLL